MEFTIKFAQGTNAKKERKFITFINKELAKHRRKKYVMCFNDENELAEFKKLYRLEHPNLDFVYKDRLGRNTLVQPENNTFTNYTYAFFVHKNTMLDYEKYMKHYTTQYYLND